VVLVLGARAAGLVRIALALVAADGGAS